MFDVVASGSYDPDTDTDELTFGADPSQQYGPSGACTYADYSADDDDDDDWCDTDPDSGWCEAHLHSVVSLAEAPSGAVAAPGSDR